MNLVKKIVRKLIKIASTPVKQTEWYRQAFADALGILRCNISIRDSAFQSFDIVNIGSSASKFGLDYSSTGFHGANWATAPQSIREGWCILKQYHSLVREQGIVFIPLICPFNGLVPGFHSLKPYLYLQPTLIPNFSFETLKQISREVEYPFLCHPKTSIKQLVKKAIGRTQKYPDPQTDAANRITSWKKEFSISSFTEPLSAENKSAIASNIETLCEMVAFCKERELRPVIGVMPVTKTLREQIPEEFMQVAFWDMVEAVQERTGVQVLDYFRSDEFSDEGLYLDSFLLTPEGAKKFTEKVVKEVENA
jgi:hypothetical protein